MSDTWSSMYLESEAMSIACRTLPAILLLGSCTAVEDHADNRIDNKSTILLSK